MGIITLGSIPSYYGYMGFNVTNAANKYTVACSITDFELGYFLVNFTEGDKWIDRRSIALDPSHEQPKYKIITGVRFNAMSRKISVHQVCFYDANQNEGGNSSSSAAAAVMFERTGTVNIPLDCVRSGLPREFQISITCTAPEFTTANSNTSRMDLLANALSQPKSDLPNYTASSFYFSG